MRKIADKLDQIKEKTRADWIRLCVEDCEVYIEAEFDCGPKEVMQAIHGELGFCLGYEVVYDDVYRFATPWEDEDFEFKKRM